MVLGGSFPSRHLVPCQKTTLHESAVIRCGEVVPFGPKVIEDRPNC